MHKKASFTIKKTHGISLASSFSEFCENWWLDGGEKTQTRVAAMGVDR